MIARHNMAPSALRIALYSVTCITAETTRMTHADFYEYGLPIQSPYYPGDIVTPDLPPQYLVFKPCLLSDL